MSEYRDLAAELEAFCVFPMDPRMRKMLRDAASGLISLEASLVAARKEIAELTARHVKCEWSGVSIPDDPMGKAIAEYLIAFPGAAKDQVGHALALQASLALAQRELDQFEKTLREIAEEAEGPGSRSHTWYAKKARAALAECRKEEI